VRYFSQDKYTNALRSRSSEINKIEKPKLILFQLVRKEFSITKRNDKIAKT